MTAPPLPVNFVERPEALAVLRDALISDDGGRYVMLRLLTALEGMGGIGKTVLAQALCDDEVWKAGASCAPSKATLIGSAAWH